VKVVEVVKVEVWCGVQLAMVRQDKRVRCSNKMLSLASWFKKLLARQARLFLKPSGKSETDIRSTAVNKK